MAEGYSLLVCEGPLTTKVLAAMDACTAQRHINSANTESIFHSAA